MGYRYSFIHNTLLVVILGIFIASIWLIAIMVSRCKRNTLGSTMMSNCMVRFLLEAHLELTLCAAIAVSNADDATIGSYWILGLMTILFIATMGFFTYRILKPAKNVFNHDSDLTKTDDKYDAESASTARSQYNSNVPLNQ